MRIIHFFALAGVVAVSGTTQAQGPFQDKRFYIAPQATYLLADDQRGVDDVLGYSLSLGKTLGRGSNLEISADWLEPDSSGEARAPELVSYGIGLMMFPMRQRLPFYVLARIGRGESRFEQEDGNDIKADSDQFDIGLGYLYGLGQWPLVGRGPALRIDARYRHDKYSRGEAEIYAAQAGTAVQRNQADVLISLGLQIPLGADPSAVVPVAERPADEVVFVRANDADGDGIPDELDQCPDTPAGARVDAQGCEYDSDGDGVPDSRDACPGTAPGLAVDARGCAPDADNDGILDINDECPNTPAGLPVMADGCALVGDCRLPQAGQAVDARGCAADSGLVLQGVQFAFNSAELTPAAQRVLDDVARAIRSSRGIVFEVGGHTDSIGDPRENLQLSEQRAVAVKNYLVAQGVSANILAARGYGASKPLRPNNTEAQRAENRRVELIPITRRR